MTVPSKLQDAHSAAVDAIGASGDPIERYDAAVGLLAWHQTQIEVLTAVVAGGTPPPAGSQATGHG